MSYGYGYRPFAKWGPVSPKFHQGPAPACRSIKPRGGPGVRPGRLSHSGGPRRVFVSEKSPYLVQLWPFTSYNWLFLWDYTFYKWGYKYL